MTLASAFSGVPRHNIYNSIHKALRRQMFDTLVALGCADVANDQALSAILERIDTLLDALRGHALHENEHIHPALEARAPASSLRIGAQHDEHIETISVLKEQCRMVRATCAEEREAAIQDLYRSLALFTAENLRHMHLEETAHNHLLWAHYSDNEIAAIEQSLVAGLTAEELELSLRWMADAASPQELARMG